MKQKQMDTIDLYEISVVDIAGNDSKKALEIYKELHGENQDREL